MKHKNTSRATQAGKNFGRSKKIQQELFTQQTMNDYNKKIRAKLGLKKKGGE